MGNTEYYLSKMIVRELLQGVSPADSHKEWWNDLPAQERIQRDADLKRVEREIAPYLANHADRFFGALIIVVYDGKIEFENLIKDFNMKIPSAYRNQANDMGFITIIGGKLLVLDGQHRWYALQHILRGETKGDFASLVPDDEISVIFINHESSEKTRRIFNKVNRYAKQTSRGENLMTSEDDGYAIVTRNLILSEDGPFQSSGKISTGKAEEGLVNWKSNTLSTRSHSLTTLSALYEMTKLILQTDVDERFKGFDEKHRINRPSAELLEAATEILIEFWNSLFGSFTPYKRVADMGGGKLLEDMRKPEHEYSLLFKPAGQIAFILGFINVLDKTGLGMIELTNRANRLRWSMVDEHWKNIIVNPNGLINAGPDARDQAARLIHYLLAADRMSALEVEQVKESFNKANGINIHNPEGKEVLTLPEPAVELEKAL